MNKTIEGTFQLILICLNFVGNQRFFLALRERLDQSIYESSLFVSFNKDLVVNHLAFEKYFMWD